MFLTVLALGATAHALFTAVRRRAADLAVLRALGMTPRQTRGVVVVQGVVTAVIGLVAGVPLGLALGRALWRAAAAIMPLQYAPPSAALVWLAPVALVAVLGLALSPRPPGRPAPARRGAARRMISRYDRRAARDGRDQQIEPEVELGLVVAGGQVGRQGPDLGEQLRDRCRRPGSPRGRGRTSGSPRPRRRSDPTTYAMKTRKIRTASRSPNPAPRSVDRRPLDRQHPGRRLELAAHHDHGRAGMEWAIWRNAPGLHPDPFGPRRGRVVGELDLGQDGLGHRVEQGRLVRHVVVERHHPDPEVGGDPAHGDRVGSSRSIRSMAAATIRGRFNGGT